MPHSKYAPFVGRLEALTVKGSSRRDLGKDLSLGDTLEVEWVYLADPEASEKPTADQVDRVLCVNVQEPGITLAITGPFSA